MRIPEGGSSRSLLGAILGVALIVLGLGLIGFAGTRSFTSKLEAIVNVRMPAVIALQSIEEAQQAIWVAERGLVNDRMREPSIRAAQYAWIDEHMRRIQEAKREYEALPRGTRSEALWGETQHLWAAWLGDHQQIRALSEERDLRAATGASAAQLAKLDDAAFAASLRSRSSLLAIARKLDELVEVNRAEALRAREAAMAAAARARATVAILALIGAGLAVSLAIALSWSVRAQADRQLLQELTAIAGLAGAAPEGTDRRREAA